jgi:non-canonical purine NTP pyrophosphatase (RdgB/HAM1 family)
MRHIQNHLPVFITGNQSKADYLAKYLGYEVEHQKVELDELQSLDLRTIVEHKVRQAFAVVGKPVLVEDVSLEFTAFGRFPGTFIKHFVGEVPMETVCRSLDSLDRGAIARCMFGYFDGTKMTFFEGELRGTIAEHPVGTGGYGWDQIFIPDGYQQTRAEMNEADDKKTYMKIKPFEQLKAFLETANTQK